METKHTVLSGMRPSGKLHIGHYISVLTNWKKLQEEYNCFYFVADLHALTTEYNPKWQKEKISNFTYEMICDWLSCGVDPDKATIFCQSDIPEHSELHLILSMITPLGMLYSCPTYKEQLKEQKQRDLNTYGFLGYPVLQSADILLYKSTKVPVGKDQIPHIELAREIARKFNFLYGKYFPEPEALLTEFPYLPGIDGRKMSKSYNNCIYLSDTPDEIKTKIMKMFTDPKKIHKNDKGNPVNCVVYAFHKIFNPEYKNVEELCKSGKLGCVEDKNHLFELVERELAPIREKRKNFDKQKIIDILKAGKEKAAKVAKTTITDVKNLIGLTITKS